VIAFLAAAALALLAACAQRPPAAAPEPLAPVYTLSRAGRNVVILMLDRAISGYLPYILQEKPEIEAALSGFVYYPNCVSFGRSTLFGAPPLFGGYEYTPEAINARPAESLRDKHNEALLALPVLFSRANWQVTVTDPPWANYSWTPDLSIFAPYPAIRAANLIGRHTDWWLARRAAVRAAVRVEDPAAVLKRGLLWYSLFRIAPTALRPLIYDDGDWLSSGDGYPGFPRLVLDSYAALDLLPALTRVDDDPGGGADSGADSGARNTLTVITSNLTHDSAFLMEGPYTVPTAEENPEAARNRRSAGYHVNMAALLLVTRWVEFLRREGVYDNTRIIVASDHGHDMQSAYPGNITLPTGQRVQAYNPLLLVKDFSTAGLAAPFTVDRTFMTNADVPLLAVQGLFDAAAGGAVNPFTGRPLRADKADGVTITTSPRWGPEQHRGNTFTIARGEWLRVQGNIFDPAAWTRP